MFRVSYLIIVILMDCAVGADWVDGFIVRVVICFPGNPGNENGLRSGFVHRYKSSGNASVGIDPVNDGKQVAHLGFGKNAQYALVVNIGKWRLE